MENEFVEVYKFANNGKDKLLYKTTDINKKYLTEQDIERLEEGLNVYGKDLINSTLEDFE